ncbi:hypothetical protein GCM10010319_23540 [Streptomyces blastmyceticus]|uniref:Uncharacterized protein n=1 Tax=Streptomyces blastmyceticus TaxID=68180 RepID=A0ABN0WTI8_9ACTN
MGDADSGALDAPLGEVPSDSTPAVRRSASRFTVTRVMFDETAKPAASSAAELIRYPDASILDRSSSFCPSTTT